MNGFVAALEHHKETRVGIMHAFFGEYGSVGVILMIFSRLTDTRFGCICGAIGLNKVCGFSSLVFPLPYVHRSRLHLCRLFFFGLPFQKAGWCALR